MEGGKERGGRRERGRVKGRSEAGRECSGLQTDGREGSAAQHGTVSYTHSITQDALTSI